MGKGPLAWIGPVLKTKEHELVNLIGLDATIFLRMLRMCRNIFLCITVVGCGILIPINMIKGVQNNEDQYATKADFVSRVTPINVHGRANWGMTICAWLFDITVIFFLWWNYRAVLRLRRTYFESPDYQNSLHARTLMVGIFWYFWGVCACANASDRLTISRRALGWMKVLGD
jgi:hypothetical protein